MLVLVLLIAWPSEAVSDQLSASKSSLAQEPFCFQPVVEDAADDVTCFLQQNQIHYSGSNLKLRDAKQHVHIANSSSQQASLNAAHRFLIFFIVYNLCAVFYEFWSRWVGDKEKGAAIQGASTGRFVNRSREYGWDVLKFLLLFFVILSHWGLLISHFGSSEVQTSIFFHRVRHQAVTVGSSFTMCTFAFISGVFGTSFSWTSLPRLSCCTVFACIIYVLLFYSASALVEGKYNFHAARFFPSICWYLVALFLWRVCITPMFMSGEFLGVSRLSLAFIVNATLICIYCIYCKLIFILRTGPDQTMYLGTHYWDVEGALFCLGPIYFAQYYAVGCILSAKQWTLLMQRQLSFAIAGGGLAVWIICLVVFDGKGEGFCPWADSMCMCEDQCRLDTSFWHPDVVITTALTHGLALASVSAFIRIFVQKVFLTLALVCLVLNAVSWLQERIPQFIQFIAECGSRSLFGFLLSYFLQLQLFDHPGYGMAHFMIMALSKTTPAFVSVFVYFLSFQNLLLLTSRFTCLIFDPILQPVWILRLCTGSSQERSEGQ